MKKWIQTLSNKDRESFLEFCKKTASPVQIYLFSRFLGFQGTIVECNEWSEKEFKKRNFHLVLESEIDNMQDDISKLRQAIDMGLVKQDMGAARIAMLQKELRGAIKQLDDKKVLMDKQGLILAGADISKNWNRSRFSMYYKKCCRCGLPSTIFNFRMF